MKEPQTFGFGERLRAARLALDMTGEELGRGTGPDGKDASKASVSDWERERHYPKADQLRLICLKLGISSDALLFGETSADRRVVQATAALRALSDEQRRAALSDLRVTEIPQAAADEREKSPKRRASKR